MKIVSNSLDLFARLVYRGHNIWREQPKFTARVRLNVGWIEFHRIHRAYRTMWRLHGNQYRDNGDCYVVHTFGVAERFVLRLGFDDDVDAIVAALLHDSIEDTKNEFIQKDYPEIARRQLFRDWAYAAWYILLLSHPKWETTEHYFGELASRRAGYMVRALKLCDVDHNVGTLDGLWKDPARQARKAEEYFSLLDLVFKLLLEDPTGHAAPPEHHEAIREMMEQIERGCRTYLPTCEQ